MKRKGKGEEEIKIIKKDILGRTKQKSTVISVFHF